MAFDELYQEIIRDHYKNPKNKTLLGPDIPVYENPSCGDTVKIQVLWDENEKIKQIKFDGNGCSISMSSTSMMTDYLVGLTRAEAQRAVQHFLRMFRGEDPSEDLDEMGDLVALKGVIQLPVRVKCATLAWNGVLKALDLP